MRSRHRGRRGSHQRAFPLADPRRARRAAGDVSTRLLETDSSLAPGVGAHEVHAAWLVPLPLACSRCRATLSVPPITPQSLGSGHGLPAEWAASVRVALRLDTHGAPASIAESLPLQHWLSFRREPEGVTVVLDARRIAWRCDAPRATCSRATSTVNPVRARIELDHGRLIVRRQCLRFDFVEDTGAEHRVSAEHEGTSGRRCPGTCSTCACRPASGSSKEPCCSCSRR